MNKLKTCKDCLHYRVCGIRKDFEIFLLHNSSVIKSMTRMKINLFENCKDKLEQEDVDYGN